MEKSVCTGLLELFSRKLKGLIHENVTQILFFTSYDQKPPSKVFERVRKTLWLYIMTEAHCKNCKQR
jgi:hypothetical protein